MEITDLGQLDRTKSYTYFDYLSWKIKERVELIKGKVFEMSPAPASRHQRISAKIGFNLQKHLELKSCEVFYAPFDVRLEKSADDKLVTTVVQPDICVICDETKIDEKGCLGAPDLIVEILSPGNSSKEMKNKFELYQEAGVLEYWIVDPEKEVIWQYSCENGTFVNHKPLIEDDTLISTSVIGFEMELSKLF